MLRAARNDGAPGRRTPRSARRGTGEGGFETRPYVYIMRPPQPPSFPRL
ncbi:MAG: hypothetical protein LBM98_13110 [Oscillospiraceae bacterium]|nr:hypothetical protein [Oscillospiraceae bacterium]